MRGCRRMGANTRVIARPSSMPPCPPLQYPPGVWCARAKWPHICRKVRRSSLRSVRLLTPEECLDPGYHRDRDWTVRDVVAYLGTWLAEAQVQFERIRAGTSEGHDI